jgi:hypothetical protein
MNRLIILALTLLFSSSFTKSDDVDVFIGTWDYQFSRQGDKVFVLKIDSGLILSKIKFYRCDHKSGAIYGRDIVLRNYKSNYFRDICTETFLNNKPIEKGFPVCHYAKDNEYSITNYGKINRKIYIFNIISIDTLKVYDYRYEIKAGKEVIVKNSQYSVYHYFIKKNN